MDDWVYDIETYIDLFSAGFKRISTGEEFIYEVSSRRNDSIQLLNLFYWLRTNGSRLFGFNNLGFDWIVCDHLIKIGDFTPLDAYTKAQEVIQRTDRFPPMIWPRDRVVPQGDLYKIHHFDNMSRSTSLKKLEINMRSDSVQDLPYPPHDPTTDKMKSHIINYMMHDVRETAKFYDHSLSAIKFRDELAAKYPNLGDVLNFSDATIGKKFVEMELQNAGTACYVRGPDGRQPIQTIRPHIKIGEIISPKVAFKHPSFRQVLDWLSQQTITPDQTKGFFKGLSATVDGFQYDFGLGGIHGSVNRRAIRECDEWEIWDWDVASYYPNLAITHRLYPAHLSESFCDIYEGLFKTRRTYKKGTPENAMYKLGLNAVYGDSNNKYSVFFDPQYTMSTTINGQLLLCMLAEWLRAKGVEMIQINTDGLTVRVRKDHVEWMKSVCQHWEQHTGLELESVRYKSMFVRDVNNYLAVTEKDKIKRIGAYAYQTPLEDPATRERPWHKDHSCLVVPKAAEAQMVHGTSVEDFILNHRDPFDFMLSVKVRRSDRLEWGDQIQQNTSRYYISTSGGKPLVKVMPPLSGKTEERRIGVDVGWNVTMTNRADRFDWNNLNWLYYIEEAKKLTIADN